MMSEHISYRRWNAKGHVSLVVSQCWVCLFCINTHTHTQRQKHSRRGVTRSSSPDSHKFSYSAISRHRFQFKTLCVICTDTDTEAAYKDKGATNDIKAFERHQHSRVYVCGWINNGCVCVHWRVLYTHAKTTLEFSRAALCACLTAKWH